MAEEIRWIASQTEDEGVTWLDAILGEVLTPSADLPACRDEDPATAAVLAAAYPDPPEYPHPEDDDALPS